MAQPGTIPAPAPLHLSSHLANSSPSVISRTMMAALTDRSDCRGLVKMPVLPLS